MSLDAIARVQARVAAIEQHFRAGVPQAPAPGSTPTDSFATTLDRVGPSAPARRLQPGAYGRLHVPEAVRRYQNGRIPATALESIGVGPHRLAPAAARAFRRMHADATAAGARLGVTDSYRDFDTQVDLAQRKGLYSNGGLAARPGTSPHGWGLAVDVDVDATGQAWLRENGWRYGFVEDTPREPWHWTYRPDGVS